MTRPYAEVIGDPISHSKSPLIHGFWLEKLGIDAEYRATHVRPDELAAWFAARRGDPLWRGCNITMPHKIAVAELVDGSEPDAALAGAVNTVVPTGQGLTGYNTDIEGVAEPLRRIRIAPYPTMWAIYAQIIGAGGAARAARLGLMRADACTDCDVFVRDPVKAQSFAEWAGAPHGVAQSLAALGSMAISGEPESEQHYSHIIVNASPLGMTGQPPLEVDLQGYNRDTIVFDMVYDPVETGLLRAARERGLRTIDGLEMLVAQAAAAFHLFFGQPAPREHDAALRRLLTR